MKKILIVEDESVVREKIVKDIQWSEEIVLAGKVENGAEALKLCERVMPDIVFADIQMPVMDGIALAERLKKKNPYIRIVLLTTYSEFGYAQKAIDLAVDKYVLKYETGQRELNQIIQEICRKIDIENQSGGRREALRRFLFEKLSPDECKRLMNRAGILWNQNRVYLCCVNHGSKENISSICAGLKTEQNMTDYHWVSESSAVIFCKREQGSEACLRSEIKRLAETNRELLFIDMEEETDAWKIHEAFLKMLKVNEMFLFFGERNLISTGILDLVTPFLYQDDLLYIREDISQRRYDTAAERIRLLLEKKAMNSRNKKALEECLDQLTAEIFEEVSRRDDAVSHSYALDLFKKVHSCRNMKQIVELLTEELGRIKRTENLSRKMCRILDYLDKNYLESITQEDLARQFDWNPSYLSQMFRKELGITYKEYINERKLKKAKELLAEGKLSVEQIAELTGYGSVNYFYKIFKKKTGKKPREY